MSKFEIEYYKTFTKTTEIEAQNDDEAIKNFREINKLEGIKSIKYIYEGNEEPKGWFCEWWNGNSWKNKVIIAHDKEEIIYNIKNSLDYAVYYFRCCLNTPEAKEGLMRSRLD